jgi:proteic killer suppression protein
VRFRFISKKLEQLYTTEAGARKYPPAVVDAFFEAMAAIDAAADERDLRALRGFHFEALKGKRTGQHSMRLNKQFRLIIRIDRDDDGRLICSVEIADYHQ